MVGDIVKLAQSTVDLLSDVFSFFTNKPKKGKKPTREEVMEKIKEADDEDGR